MCRREFLSPDGIRVARKYLHMLASDEDILRKVQEWTVRARRRSCDCRGDMGVRPRGPVGSHLLSMGPANFLGSVSGGLASKAMSSPKHSDVIGTGGRRMLEFGIADETAWRAGLSCGGRIRVYVESLDSNQAELLAVFNAERAARNPCVLITHVTSGEQRLVRAADIAADPWPMYWKNGCGSARPAWRCGEARSSF